MRMSQVCGQLRHVAFDINPRTIPTNQRANGKSVPEIVQVCPFRPGWSPQTNPTGNPQKLFFCCDYLWTVAVVQNKESQSWSLWLEVIALTPIQGELMHGTAMDRNQPRFAPFGSTNRQNALGQIDVCVVQIQALAQTHSRDCEQTKKRSKRFRAYLSGHIGCHGRLEESPYFVLGVNVRPSSPIAPGRETASNNV